MKNKFLKLLIFATIICCIMPSCATIVSKATYPISIKSNPDGALIVVKNKKGEVVIKGTTPTIVKLDASSKYMSGERYELTINYPGHKEEIIYINSRIDGWYWGNILVGGLIGMLIVDPLSGAMYQLDTEAVNVNLVKSSDTSLNIVDINTLPDEMKDNLVKIN